MADTVHVHEAHQEFWRPPVSQSETPAILAEACRRCGTEFMVGAAFCHVCGSSRHHTNAVSVRKWTHYLGILSLAFVRVKNWLGLPALSFWAFITGVGFMIGALAMGLVDTKDSTLNFEAVQLWRIQWMMAACASFLVGILFKNQKPAN